MNMAAIYPAEWNDGFVSEMLLLEIQSKFGLWGASNFKWQNR